MKPDDRIIVGRKASDYDACDRCGHARIIHRGSESPPVPHCHAVEHRAAPCGCAGFADPRITDEELAACGMVRVPLRDAEFVAWQWVHLRGGVRVRAIGRQANADAQRGLSNEGARELCADSPWRRA